MSTPGTDILIDIAAQYSPYPSGRFPSDGHYNGELFRNSILAPALKRGVEGGNLVVVDIDGVRSFGSSFLEEAFAGLVRLGFFDKEVVKRHLRIQCTKTHLLFFKEEIEDLVAKAMPQAARAS